MTIKIKKLSARAELPKYAHPGEDACFDLKVLIDDAKNDPFRFCNGIKCPVRNDDRYEDEDGNTTGIWMRPGDSVVFKTGLAFDVGAGNVMKIYPRSSTGIRDHLRLSNGVGIIDAGYRGEVHIALTNFGEDSICVHDGSRVAQAEICQVLPVEIEEADDLSQSSRGTGGIGSSGK